MAKDRRAHPSTVTVGQPCYPSSAGAERGHQWHFEDVIVSPFLERKTLRPGRARSFRILQDDNLSLGGV
jgi:hypothetical protein